MNQKQQQIVEALKDPDVQVRRNAAHDFGDLNNPDPRAFEALTQFFYTENDTNARMWCVLSIGKLRDKRAFDFLRHILQFEFTRDVRSEIMTAFGLLGDMRALDILSQALKQENNLFVRVRAAQVLGKLGGEQVIEPLIEALDDCEGTVRFCTVRVLGELGDKRVLPKLKWLKENDNFLQYEPGDLYELTVSQEATYAIKRISEKQS